MEKKKINIFLIIQTAVAAAVSMAVIYSHCRTEPLYTEINRYADYVMLHNTDIDAWIERLEAAGGQIEFFIDEKLLRHLPVNKNAAEDGSGGDYDN